jgi:hypothetical protein
MYFRYPLIYGIAAWRGSGIEFTDGICRRCFRRVQAELRALERRRHPTADRSALRGRRAA